MLHPDIYAQLARAHHDKQCATTVYHDREAVAHQQPRLHRRIAGLIGGGLLHLSAWLLRYGRDEYVMLIYQDRPAPESFRLN